METVQAPSVGRIVHVFERNSRNPSPFAAIVAHVQPDEMTINAMVISEFGTQGGSVGIPHASVGSESYRYWDWPERV